jgi:hypothetical protein
MANVTYHETKHRRGKIIRCKLIGRELYKPLKFAKFMFKVIQNGINRLDIEMSGKLNADKMRIALDELVSK